MRRPPSVRRAIRQRIVDKWVEGDTDCEFEVLWRIAQFSRHVAKAKANVTSGRRSYAEQEALYAKYKRGGALAAVPGTSRHESGLAADVWYGGTPIGKVASEGALRKYGLYLAVRNRDGSVREYWHVEPCKAA